MSKKLILGIAAFIVFAGVLGIMAVRKQPTEPPPQEFAIPANQEVAAVQEQDSPVGATIPVVVSLFETSLASKITSSDSSMTLVSGSDRNGTALSGYMCFTLDEGTASVEYVCGTASSTAISSLRRGLDPLTGTSSVASLKKEHRRGATVKITNFPQLAIVSRILNGDETLPNPIKYDSSISTSTVASNSANLVNVALLNATAFLGAPNATTSLQGLVQAGTAAQLAISTQNGSSGAVLFAPGNLYASTSAATTLIPMTKSTGKIAQGFLDLTEAYSWTGLHTFTASTTMASTTITNLVVSAISGPGTGLTGIALADNVPNTVSSFGTYETTVIRPYALHGWTFTGTDVQTANGVINTTTTNSLMSAALTGRALSATSSIAWNSGIDLRISYVLTPTATSTGVTAAGAGDIWFFHGFGDGAGADTAGDITNTTQTSAGFAHYNGKIYSVTRNAGGVTANQIVANDPGQAKQQYMIDYTPSNVKFYINGTLMSTHTTFVATSSAAMLLNFGGYSGSGTAVGVRVSPITISETLN